METVTAPPRLLRVADVMERTGLPKPSLYARMKNGTFPKPISLGTPRSVAWVEADVTSWILETIARSGRTR